MPFSDIVFRPLNKAGTSFVEMAVSEKQLPDNHQVTVSNTDLSKEAKQLPDNHNVTVSNQPLDYPLPTVQLDLLTPQKDSLTDTELRASPVVVDTQLLQGTTPVDTQPISAVTLPLPSGAAIESKQLPDNHQVVVSNHPLDYPDLNTKTAIENSQELCDGQTATRVKACEILPVYMGIPPQEIGTRFFTNPDFGISMNIDGTAGDSFNRVDWIHGGGPSGEAPIGQTAWTTSQPIGGTSVNFSATGVLETIDPFEGTYFVDARSALAGDVWQFTADTTPIVASATHIHFKMYVARWDSNPNRDCFVQLMNGAIIASSEVSLRSDVGIDRTGSIGVWQTVRIPLALFNLTTPWTSVRFRLGHNNVDLAFDNITLQQEVSSGLNSTFTVTPQEGKRLIVEVIQFSFVANSALTAGGTPIINHDGFGNLPRLTEGILYERIQNGVVGNSFAIRRMWDLIRVPLSTLEVYASSDTETAYIVTFPFSRPVVLDYSKGDSVNYTVRDNLSEILEMSISLDGAQVDDPNWVP